MTGHRPFPRRFYGVSNNPNRCRSEKNWQKFGRSKAIIFQKEARYSPNDGCSIKGMHMGV
jgi:hypothetical protein